MTQILLPDYMERRLTFYLAMEEYIAGRKDIAEAFFLWRVAPTVIIGRNQDIEAEVNLPWCREHGVDVCRRKSGGGCVYADMGNIMISYVTDGENVQEIFRRYMEKVAEALRALGLNAEVSGRNDILVDGRKVSGNAYHVAHGRSTVHGTLLCDTDFEAMASAITPSAEKLQSKGIASVRQRVGNLKDCLSSAGTGGGISGTAGMIKYLTNMFHDKTIMLNTLDINNIEAIEQTYLDSDFIFGK